MKSCSARIEIDSLSQEDWDRTVSAFADVTYDQTACFAAGWQDQKRSSHLLLRRDGEVVAAARLNLYTLPGVGTGVAFCRGGPIWRRLGRPADPELFRSVLAALVEEYAVRRGHLLTVLPPSTPLAYDQQDSIMQEFGFAVRRPVFFGTHYYVKAALLSEDQRHKSLSKTWRYNLRVAQRNDIEITISRSSDSLDAFCQMHSAMLQRKRLYNTHDRLDILPALWNLPDAMRPHVVMGSYRGQPVCGAIISVLGEMAVHTYGASDETSLPIQASYGLHWWVLNWVAAQGLEWYNLGSDGADQGLRQYKLGFVGKTGRVITQGEYDLWSRASSRRIGDQIYRLRELRRRGRSVMAQMQGWTSTLCK